MEGLRYISSNSIHSKDAIREEYVTEANYPQNEKEVGDLLRSYNKIPKMVKSLLCYIYATSLLLSKLQCNEIIDQRHFYDPVVERRKMKEKHI